MQLEEYLEFGLVQNLCRYCTGKKTMGGAGTHTGHTGHTGHKRITRTVLEESFWILQVGEKMGDSQMFVNGQMNVND